TLAQTSSPQEFATAFDGRIQAMAAAYSLVSRENWNEVPLREVITEQLKPHEAGEQVEISGPDIHVKPVAALALGLVVHELTTNAAKYGSLSRPDGRVSATWSIQSDSFPLLVLHWREAGGPPARKPARKGFGTTLIERELKQTLGGSSRFRYNESGLEATLSMPFDPKLMSIGPAPKSS